jgi:heterodisulfide reductase subunit A
VSGLDNSVHQYHLFRDIRTYGRYEAIYEKALRAGSVFLRYSDEDPPTVALENGGLVVKVKDRLMGGEEVEIRPDLVVLVTGMVPRDTPSLVETLKLPVGNDGFFREVHVKLRPVETVVDGVFIVGASQGPKNVAESVASSLAAVSKTGGLLLRGYVDLEPTVARVDPTRCVWCDECTKACPYGAIESTEYGEKRVAEVNRVLCKGGGACVPACPRQAISVEGYTNEQVTAMIDALAEEATG